MSNKLIGFIFIALLLGLLEIACRLHWLDPVYFPAPTSVIAVLFGLLQTGEFWGHLGATVMRAGAGYLCAMLVAVPVGLLMGKFRWVDSLLEPVVDVLRTMPSAAVIPVAILLFGIEDQMKIFVIIFGAMWATIISTVDGIRGVESLLLDTGRLMQLSPSQMITRIILPAAMPTIVTGMRISLAIALILAVTSEMIAGSNGLGYFILDAERGFAFHRMYAGIVVIGMVGYVVSRLFVIIESRLLFWHYVPRTGSDGLQPGNYI
jgi:ABC-type nitrate/sulfonate/bicarbonate transport system permease component